MRESARMRVGDDAALRQVGGARRFPGPAGTELVADVHGPVGAPTVLLLHGGGQTRHAWGASARRLGEAGWQAVALDMPGHGDSGWPEDGDYSTPVLARAVAGVLGELPRPVAVVGASLGGLSAIGAIGLDDPPPIDVLVLVDVAPRIEAEGVQRIVDFMTAYPEGFASLEDAALHVARYKGYERSGPSRLDGLKKNLRLNAAGRWIWHWDPRLMHARNHEGRRDSQALERALRDWRRPTLLVRGGRSDVVSLEGARALQDLVPGARFVDLADAGHMVAGDANDEFTQTIVDFLREAMPSSAIR
ncbi:MAG: alpha/beta hydrolase [Burkholderiaceae bacterium]|nr:alpha/beta hydrolase [Burkholderiaceae bacterium]